MKALVTTHIVRKGANASGHGTLRRARMPCCFRATGTGIKIKTYFFKGCNLETLHYVWQRVRLHRTMSQGDNARLFILNGRLTSRFYLIKLNKLSHLFAFVFIAFQSPLTRGRCGLSHHAGACAKRATLHVYFLPKVTVAKVRLLGNLILYFLEQISY
jgi:hypothetical protein